MKPACMPKSIVESLIKHQSHSLESLTLRGDDSNDQHFIGSLTSLHKLKTVCIESSMFIDNEYQRDYSRRGTGYYAHRVHALSEMLPTSIETLTFTDKGITENVAAKLLEGFVNCEKNDFLSLKSIIFQQRIGLSEKVRAYFEAVGVKLRTGDNGISKKTIKWDTSEEEDIQDFEGLSKKTCPQNTPWGQI